MSIDLQATSVSSVLLHQVLLVSLEVLTIANTSSLFHSLSITLKSHITLPTIIYRLQKAEKDKQTIGVKGAMKRVNAGCQVLD
jgi:hypothetical protein